MKNAANCENLCELQDTWTSTFWTHIAVYTDKFLYWSCIDHTWLRVVLLCQLNLFFHILENNNEVLLCLSVHNILWKHYDLHWSNALWLFTVIWWIKYSNIYICKSMIFSFFWYFCNILYTKIVNVWHSLKRKRILIINQYNLSSCETTPWI